MPAPNTTEQMLGLYSPEERQKLEDAKAALFEKFFDGELYATKDGLSPACDGNRKDWEDPKFEEDAVLLLEKEVLNGAP